MALVGAYRRVPGCFYGGPGQQRRERCPSHYGPDLPRRPSDQMGGPELRPADHGPAGRLRRLVRSRGPQADYFDRRRPLHPRKHPLRHRAFAHTDDHLPGHPGHRRCRHRIGHHGDCHSQLRSCGTRQGDGSGRPDRPARCGCRAQSRRPSHRRIRVAGHLLHQRPLRLRRFHLGLPSSATRCRGPTPGL